MWSIEPVEQDGIVYSNDYCAREATREPGENERRGEDGLLYCAICHEKKQVRSEESDGKISIYPRQCRCAREQLEARERERAEQERRERVTALRGRSRIEPKFRGASFEKITVTDENREAFGFCRKYARDFAKFQKTRKGFGLYLWGAVGTGKTLFACAAGNALLEKGIRVVKCCPADAIEAREQKQHGDNGLWDQLRDAQLLIFDDLGSQRDTAYANEIVFSLIDYRVNSEQPMILTSNISILRGEQDLTQQRIYDRIREVCFPIEFRGRSWRLKTAAESFDKMRGFLSGAVQFPEEVPEEVPNEPDETDKSETDAINSPRWVENWQPL